MGKKSLENLKKSPNINSHRGYQYPPEQHNVDFEGDSTGQSVVHALDQQVKLPEGQNLLEMEILGLDFKVFQARG